jgi:hypothetical protein
VAKQLTVVNCLVDCGRFLVSIKIYLPPQYDQYLFIGQHFFKQPTSAQKPFPDEDN